MNWIEGLAILIGILLERCLDWLFRMNHKENSAEKYKANQAGMNKLKFTCSSKYCNDIYSSYYRMKRSKNGCKRRILVNKRWMKRKARWLDRWIESMNEGRLHQLLDVDEDDEPHRSTQNQSQNIVTSTCYFYILSTLLKKNGVHCCCWGT